MLHLCVSDIVFVNVFTLRTVILQAENERERVEVNLYVNLQLTYSLLCNHL